MNENSTTQQKQWNGIEPSPMKLTAVRSRQTHVNIDYDEQLDDESLYPTRQPSSTRRYRTDTIPSQGLAHMGRKEVRQQDRYDDVNVYIRRKRPHQQPASHQHPRPTHPPEAEQNNDEERETERLSLPHQRTLKPHFRWLWILGIGMIVMLLLWIGGNLLMNVWQGYQEDVQYGHPRTSQCDARVGHNDAQTPSHFIALNLHKRVEVIEFPGGDGTKARVYLGPTLVGQQSDLDIVTISFKDVNGDGKPDMILSVENATYVYINDNGAFRPLHADEHINI